jgi:hypothetical protein
MQHSLRDADCGAARCAQAGVGCTRRQQLGNNSDLILVDGVGTVYVLPARVFTGSSSR